MAKVASDPLARREREIMNAIFVLGNRASAENIRAQLAKPPSYSSVRVMLSRLEKKGHVRHTEEGPRYIYSATVSRATAKRNALQQYARIFFGGSLAQMVRSLVRHGTWSDKELDDLKAEIDRARKEST